MEDEEEVEREKRRRERGSSSSAETDSTLSPTPTNAASGDERPGYQVPKDVVSRETAPIEEEVREATDSSLELSQATSR